MIRKPKLLCAALLFAVALPALAQAASPPRSLYGKSIIVTWTEERMQRRAGTMNFRSNTVRTGFRIYISTSGRVFSRLTNSNKQGTKSRDEVAGLKSDPRVRTQFSERSLTVFIGRGRGAASDVRRIAISFGNGFTSCRASVIRARQNGAPVIKSKSMVTGNQVEIQSVTATNENCGTRDGNVFAGG
jgi:hypothetical protein